MITEGLGDVIGLRIARKQTMESYLTVLLLWLLQGGTDFNSDPYLQQLMADSQSNLHDINMTEPGDRT